LGLKLGIVIDLEEGPTHLSAHLLTKLRAITSPHVRENPFGFTVKA
jgi:hypothetical protein